MTYQLFVGNNLEILPTLPDNSIDSIVTDPPYGLSDNKYVADTIARWIGGERDFVPDGKGFMGKAWDAFVPPPALWDECLRVLKPGGHLLAFFGSRTQDIGALAIRLAGFEIRDSIAWLYGSGFPKSMDISKAIDKGQGQNENRQLQFTKWMRNSGLTSSKARDVLFEVGLITEKSNQASHYFAQTLGSQPAIATADMFDALRPYLPEVPEEIERLVAERTGIEWTEYKNREVIGTKLSGIANKNEKERHTIGASQAIEVDITAPSTTEAQQWQGWGTALKPALEPIVVARKPIEGTVANNVLKWGTGGLNINGSRIGTEERTHGWAGRSNSLTQERTDAAAGMFAGNGDGLTTVRGRWPANIILDPYTAELLDEQSGDLKPATSRTARNKHIPMPNHAQLGDLVTHPVYADSGGASRFFYVAKASKRDRNEGLDELEETTAADMVDREPDSAGMNSPRAGAGRTSGAKNFHPTVKPTALMEYLVKLVTPPNGTVLDPFTGSGSTGKAAILQGFNFIGIEMTEEYVPIIEGRLKHAEAKVAGAKENQEAQPQGLF
jgi:DNA modification methylase